MSRIAEVPYYLQIFQQTRESLGSNGREAITICESHNIDLQYAPAVSELIGGGILGKCAHEEGWDNIGEHCITSFHEARVHSHLLGFDAGRAIRFNTVALLHDKDLRKEKEAHATASDQHWGITRVRVGDEFYRLHELTHPGILRVTGLDWRDYQSYTPEEAALRYIDSTVGPVKKNDGTYGTDSLQHYTQRHAALQKRKPEISQQVGDLFYGGTPAFVYLDQIVPTLEAQLYEQAHHAHPEYFEGENYPQSSDYFTLVRDLMELQSTDQGTYMM